MHRGGNEPVALTRVFFDLSGMPIDQVRKFLGHEKLETTQIYAESSPAMNPESYERALGARSPTGSREE